MHLFFFSSLLPHSQSSVINGAVVSGSVAALTHCRNTSIFLALLAASGLSSFGSLGTVTVSTPFSVV
jgi:hypothetical protein